VAPAPKSWKYKSNWSRWREKEEGSGWGEEESDRGGEKGELVLEEVKGWGDVNGWGEEREDKYKPPHIKALEEQANSDVSGW